MLIYGSCKYENGKYIGARRIDPYLDRLTVDSANLYQQLSVEKELTERVIDHISKILLEAETDLRRIKNLIDDRQINPNT